MKMRKTQVLILAVMALCSYVNAGDFYVATDGNDANPGNLKKPFATLQRAQKEARTLAGREAVNVFVRSGIYYLPETLVLTAEDSGTKSTPVTYQAYENEKSVLSGGVRLMGLDWKPYKNGIMQCKVPDGFFTDQLFVNGERQPMARYPNFNPDEVAFNGWAKDAFSPERAANWKSPTGGFIHALHRGEWGGMHYLITGKGPDNKITYDGGWQNNRQSSMNDRRFVENIFEELDVAGEWFLDSKSNVLYFYPPAGVDLDNATLEAVRLKHLVEFRSTEGSPVKFVSLKGLIFRHTSRTFMETKEPLLRSDWTIYRGGALFVTGSEDCTIEDCLIERVGGNAVFVNNYNRRFAVRGCHIAEAGGSGVAFIGDPESVRNPLFEYGQRQNLANIDKTPGPKTSNYPSDCMVYDCLIHDIGQVEKQTAGVTLDMAQQITIGHCSIYDTPRSGINIGDGCWGGHIIEYCDVFDTVKETGDHGSFNSWGRDRYWSLDGLDLNDDQVWNANKELVTLDAFNTTVIRNSRWRCDHGWDIDLDDGSSNYHIYNNLCLHGGLKNREGFYRVIENNVLINGFHPHVWYKHSQDVVRRNILWEDRYLPAGGMPKTPWGKEMDHNLSHRAGVPVPEPAMKLAEQSRRDEHSIIADAQFVDADKGDFRVKQGSPALGLGFVNFPMDQFGVKKPTLKAIARTPVISNVAAPRRAAKNPSQTKQFSYAWQAKIRNISGLGDRSAFGLQEESGVLFLNVPDASPAAKAGLQKDDVIVRCNEQPVRTIKDLRKLRDLAAGKKLILTITRLQKQMKVILEDDLYVVIEAADTANFKTVAVLPSSAVLPVKVLVGGASTNNDPIESLTDGKVVNRYGPVFANGVETGMIKLDLASVQNIAQINTFSALSTRARQNFVLYGSKAEADPGWSVDDPEFFTPIIAVDTREGQPGTFEATSIRRSDGKPLGGYRWLVWAVSPVTIDHAENTALQELQVIPMK